MLVLIAFAGLAYFWVHAQRRLGLRARLISSAVMFGAVILYFVAASNTSDFYNRGYISVVLENITAGLPDEEKAEYRKTIRNYKWDRSANPASLMQETARLKNKYHPTTEAKDHD